MPTHGPLPPDRLIRIISDSELPREDVREALHKALLYSVEHTLSSQSLPSSRHEGICQRASEVLSEVLSADRVSFIQAFPQLIERLGSKEAFRFLKDEDLGTLSRRLSTLSYLGWNGLFLRSLRELAGLLSELSSFIQHNRDHLIRFGVPQTTFYGLPRLYSHFTNLYHVRAVAGLKTAYGLYFTHDDPWLFAASLANDVYRAYLDGLLDVPGEFSIEYEWVTVKCSLDGEFLKESVPYEEADLFDFFGEITMKQGTRVEALREKLYGLKLGILDELQRCLLKPGSVNIRNACMQRIMDTLDSDEAELLLTVDRSYLGGDILASKLDPPFTLLPDGLTGILQLIGHCDKEMRIGTYSQTRKALSSFVKLDFLDRPYLAIPDYFSVAKQRERSLLDDGLDAFLSLQDEEESYWDEHRNWVNEMLKEEFSEYVTVTERVKRKHVRLFKPALCTFAAWMHSHLKASGTAPELILSPADLAMLLAKRESHMAPGQHSPPIEAGESAFLPGLRWAPDCSVAILDERQYSFKGKQAEAMRFIIGRSIQLKGPYDVLVAAVRRQNI